MLNTLEYILYTDYYNDNIQKMISTFDAHSIKCDVISRNDIRHATDCQGQLLIIFSNDIMKDLEGPESSTQFDIEFTTLQKLNRPVLWINSVRGAELDFDSVPDNVQFLHIGCDNLLQMKEYPSLLPQRDKNMSGEKFWISLNRTPRTARIVAGSYLLGLGLGTLNDSSSGLLRLSNYTTEFHTTWQEYYQYCTGNLPITLSDRHQQIMQDGFVRLKNLEHGGQPDGSIYQNLNGLDNVTNFDQALRHFYKNSFVELVNETVFFTKGVYVTEKILNSIYGYNLPIVFANPGTVDYLRQSGFDLFDDVINHSYDQIHDPLERIVAAVDLNIQLLTDKDHAQTSWAKCLHRLDANYQHAQHRMYEISSTWFHNDVSNYIDYYKSTHWHETKVH